MLCVRSFCNVAVGSAARVTASLSVPLTRPPVGRSAYLNIDKLLYGVVLCSPSSWFGGESFVEAGDFFIFRLIYCWVPRGLTVLPHEPPFAYR